MKTDGEGERRREGEKRKGAVRNEINTRIAKEGEALRRRGKS